MMDDALVFRDLTLGYDRHPAVHHLDGVVPKGDLLAVCGPNGAGKSTLLKGVAGLLKPLGGAIDRCGLRPRQIAYLPQSAQIDHAFPIDVFDMAAMGLWRECGIFRGVGRQDEERVRAALASVGLTGFERRAIGALSGGQFQRLLFARLSLQDAPIILLDEPFTAVDERTIEDLIAIIQRWSGEGRTILAVLHDLDFVRATFPHCLLLAREPVAWGGTAETLSEDNLQAARRLIEAFDADAPPCGRKLS